MSLLSIVYITIVCVTLTECAVGMLFIYFKIREIHAEVRKLVTIFRPNLPPESPLRSENNPLPGEDVYLQYFKRQG